MERSSLLTTKPTLARRVSDLFKDGNKSGTTLIFGNSSMEKLRHCCQNFGLFPYLLHSFSNSKSNDDDNNKLNLNFIVRRITEKIFVLYANIRQNTRYHFNFDNIYQKSTCHSVEAKKTADVTDNLIAPFLTINKFNKFQNEKRKTNSLLMILSVYIGMVLLIAQLIGIVSLMFIGKFAPGFVFLLCSLLFLAFLIMKVLLSPDSLGDIKKRGKRKTE